MKLLLILTLFLSCCVHTSLETDFVIDPKLSKYLEEFDAHMKSIGIERPKDAPPLVTLEFVDDFPFQASPYAIAVCSLTYDETTGKLKHAEIRVLKTSYKNEYGLKRVLLHEWQHCGYLKNHVHELHPDKEGFFYPIYKRSQKPWHELLKEYMTREKYDQAPDIATSK